MNPTTDTSLVLPAPVLVVDDDNLMQTRLISLMLQQGYSQDALHIAASVAQARALIQAQPFALALIDLGLPDGSGISLISELRALAPSTNILVISAYSTEDMIIAALRAGANGYVLKERDDFELAISIRSILRGGAPIDPFIAHRLINEFKQAPSAQEPQKTELTVREIEILRLVEQGLSSRRIAEQLHISYYTVDTHIKHIYSKLATSTRVQAVTVARSIGLFDQ